MKKAYAQAFLEIVAAGTALDVAIAGLKQVLISKKHTKLFTSILREVIHILETTESKNTAVVALASSTKSEELINEIKNALVKLGIKEDTQIIEVVDETLIGGFVATYNHQEYNRSYKRVLKSLYESITA